MSATGIRSTQLRDGDGVRRSALNITLANEAVIAKIIAGSRIAITSTGVDDGTGDVTIDITQTTGKTGTYSVVEVDDYGLVTSGTVKHAVDDPTYHSASISAVDMDYLIYEAKTTNAWTRASSLTVPAAPMISSSSGAYGIIKVTAVQSPAESVSGWELVYDTSDLTDPDTLTPMFSATGKFEFAAGVAQYVWVRAVRGSVKSTWTTTPLHSTEYNEDPISGVNGADVPGLSAFGAAKKLVYSTSSPAPVDEAVYWQSADNMANTFSMWTVASGIVATEYGCKITTSLHWMNTNHTGRRAGFICGARVEIFSDFTHETFYTVHLAHVGVNTVYAYLSKWVGSTETNIWTSGNIWATASIQINDWNDIIFTRNGDNFTLSVNGVEVLNQTNSDIPAAADRPHVGLIHATNSSQIPFGNIMLVESRNGVTTAIAPGKVNNSDKLDGYHAAYFSPATHNHGTGTDHKIVKWSGTTGNLEDSQLQDDGTNVGVGGAGNEKFTILGRLSLQEQASPTATSGYGKYWVSTGSLPFFMDDSGVTWLGWGGRYANTGTVFGPYAGNTTCTNNYSTAYGYEAGKSLTGSGYTTLFGYSAGASLTSGSYDVAIGYRALFSATGNSSVAVGYQALQSMAGSAIATAVGALAFQSTTVGAGTAMGYGAGRWCKTATTNVYVGGYAGYTASGSGNTAIGESCFTGGASFTVTSVTDNGSGLERINCTGGACVENGQLVFLMLTGHYDFYTATLISPTAFDINKAYTGTLTGTGYTAYSGTFNTAVGVNALCRASGSGGYNVAIGYGALWLSASSDKNTVVGTEAGRTCRGSENTVLGYQAGYGKRLTFSSVADNGSGQPRFTCTGHTFSDASYVMVETGIYAGYHQITYVDVNRFDVTSLTYSATSSGNVNQTANGNYNTLIGAYSGNKGMTSGSYNTALGSNSANLLITGGSNVMLGYCAGYTPAGATANATTSASYNTLVGVSTGQASTTQRNYLICLGYYAIGDQANFCAIGGSTSTYAVDVGITRTTALAKLHQTTLSTGTDDLVIGHIVDRTSSNTPAAGFGTGTKYTLKTSTTADQDAAQISTDWDVATHGSQTSILRFWTVDSGAALAERLRLTNRGAVITGSLTVSDYFATAGTYTTGISTKTSGDSPVAVGDSDTAIICNTTGGNITVNLPASSGQTGKFLYVKKTVAANSVIIDGNASETIDGATTLTLTAQYDSVMLICDGSNWHIL